MANKHAIKKQNGRRKVPLPKTIANTAEFSVRCFKPLYAEHEEEYTRWFLGHPELDAISDEDLMEMFETWKGDGGLHKSNGSPASGFADFLEANGYIIFWSPEASAGCSSPTGARRLVMDTAGNARRGA